MHNDDATAPAVAPEQGGGAAEELAYRLRQQQLTAEYGHFALRTRDTAALLQEATRVCALGLNSAFCKAMEYLPDEGQFIVRAGVGWKPGVVGYARAGADTESPTGYAFQTGKPVISNHLAVETRFRTPDILREHGVKRAINVLIQGERARYGVLEVDSPTEGRFTEADLGFMLTFASLLGVAIERQQVEQALMASEARARTSEAKLEQALAHQEMLTREISHRVKNSLSIVASLLSMQGRIALIRRCSGRSQMRKPAFRPLRRCMTGCGARTRCTRLTLRSSWAICANSSAQQLRPARHLSTILRRSP